MYRYNVCCQEFWYIVSGLDIQLEHWAIRERHSCTQKICSSLRDMTSHILFLTVHWYEPMSEWWRQVLVSRSTWVQLSQHAKILCRPFAISRGTEPVTVHCCSARGYVDALSIHLLFSNFVNGDLALTGPRQGFNSWHEHPMSTHVTVLEHLKTSWSWARGLDSATCAGLAHGRDCSYGIASEKKRQNGLGHYFSMNYRKYLKKWATFWPRVFDPHLPDCNILNLP